jgi:hypothetical protein
MDKLFKTETIYRADPISPNGAVLPTVIQEMFATFLSWGNIILATIGVLALMAAAAMWMFERDRTGQGGLGNMGKVLVAVGLGAGAWSIVNVFV